MITNLLPEDPGEVGPYRLLGRLGQGGMGVVYLARSPGGRQVAVKVIRPEYASEPRFRARFAREVAAARRVTGFFTAAVIDADTEASVPWLATAYVPGPSLLEAVETSGPLPAAKVLTLAAELTEALAAIHAAGVVHGDLKPSNVLLAADGPRVIDFGIPTASESSMLTQAGTVKGSPGYLSPEQLEGAQAGAPSDIFSLGAVLTYAATGEGPFGSGPPIAVLRRLLFSGPDLTRVPDLIRPLVERCLARDPAARPTTTELLAAFRALPAGGGAGAAESPPGTAFPAPTTPPAEPASPPVASAVDSPAPAPSPEPYAAPPSPARPPQPAPFPVWEEPPPGRARRVPGLHWPSGPARTRKRPRAEQPHGGEFRDAVSRAVRAAVRPGLLAFNPPKEMVQGKQERVEVGIARSPELRQALATGLRGRGELQVETIPTAAQMGVELKGPAFEIVPYSPLEQLIAPAARWEFDVRPRRAGLQTLTLCVSLRFDAPRSSIAVSGRVAIPILEREIRIRVDVAYGIRRFVADNWQWLVATVLGLGGALTAWVMLVH